MDLVISELKPQSVRQDKYIDTKDFKENLKEGQKFERLIGNNLYSEGLGVRIYADNNPFISKKGTIRTWDIDAISFKNNNMFHIEVKDFARTYKFNTSGLPKRYVNDILLTVPAEYIVVIFRDNMSLVDVQAKFLNKSVETVLVEMESKGFVKIIDKEVKFIPYGNSLKNLMVKEARDPVSERVCKCRMIRKYKGEDQYMWYIKNMKAWPDLVADIFNNTNYFPSHDTEIILSKELRDG